MLIISQDKGTIINLDRVSEIMVCGNEITITDDICKDYGEIIGSYETEERAKKVLEEIYLVFGVNRTIELFANIGNMTQVNKNNMTYTPVYQIPKE